MQRALLLSLVLALPLAAADGPARTMVNSRLSAKQVALNQPVRVEFTTLPRQIAGVDIPAAVARALDASRLAGLWRPLGVPVVNEHEKTKVVTIAFSLLPRRAGETPLPKVTLTWLPGDQVADLGLVEVLPKLLVAGDLRELPREASGVGGFPWGGALEEARTRVPPEQVAMRGGAIVISPQPGLDLVYRGGSLTDATLAVAMPLDRARDSFLGRWGAPQIEREDAITWVIGWTAITATPGTNGTGTVLTLQREDLQATLDRQQVETNVFEVLDGAGAAPAPTPEEQARQRAADAEREAERAMGR